MDVASVLAEAEADRKHEIEFDKFDTAAWPLVHIHLQREPRVKQVEAADGSGAFEELNELDAFESRFVHLLELARHGSSKGIQPTKLFLFINIDGIVKASVKQKMRGAGVIAQAQKYLDAIAATAVVATNRLVYATIRAIMMLRPLKSVHAMFHNNDAAMAWLRANQQRAASGLEPVCNPGLADDSSAAASGDTPAAAGPT